MSGGFCSDPNPRKGGKLCLTTHERLGVCAAEKNAGTAVVFLEGDVQFVVFFYCLSQISSFPQENWMVPNSDCRKIEFFLGPVGVCHLYPIRMSTHPTV